MSMVTAQKNNLKFVDFCAGIGAGRLGLQNLGLSCVGFSEIDNTPSEHTENFSDKKKKITAI